jgi:N-acetylglucosaminyldiphosphoundecaprenol N-acetyl-beta-D-mannosaminyltransferase
LIHSANEIEKDYFYDIPVSLVSYPALRNSIIATVRNENPTIIYGFSIHSIYSLKKTPEIIRLGKDSDIILCDGRPFYWLCKIHGLKIPEPVSIPECVNLSLSIANEHSFSIMLLGAKKEVNEQACSSLTQKYPAINILPGIDGYFDENRPEEIVKLINSYSPDILLVGISSPKKEKFVFYNRRKINAKVIIPCGGMIDILAGKTRQTPKWIKAIGLATLYRVIQEPGRLFTDRFKMLFFVFGRFLPLLIINRLFSKRQLSLVDQYSKI